MVFASRSKLCLRTGSDENCAGKILMATVRSSLVSRARYTSPIPPAPSGDSISYGPSLLPEVRAMRTRNYSPRSTLHVDVVILGVLSANRKLSGFDGGI